MRNQQLLSQPSFVIGEPFEKFHYHWVIFIPIMLQIVVVGQSYYFQACATMIRDTRDWVHIFSRHSEITIRLRSPIFVIITLFYTYPVTAHFNFFGSVGGGFMLKIFLKSTSWGSLLTVMNVLSQYFCSFSGSHLTLLKC